MLSLVFLAPALLVCVVLYKLGRFYRNVRLAKATGLPYTFSPHLEFETVAYFTTPLLREGFASRLMQGKGWPRWARFMIKDWPYEDKFRAHQELGEVFLVVAPNGIICYSADATTAMDVCTRRKEFTKPRVSCGHLPTLQWRLADAARDRINIVSARRVPCACRRRDGADAAQR